MPKTKEVKYPLNFNADEWDELNGFVEWYNIEKINEDRKINPGIDRVSIAEVIRRAIVKYINDMGYYDNIDIQKSYNPKGYQKQIKSLMDEEETTEEVKGKVG